MNRRIQFLLLFTTLFLSVCGQEKLSIRVTGGTPALPLAGVTVSSEKKTVMTDSMGQAILELSAGKHRLHFSSTGFEEKDLDITLPYTGILPVSLTEKTTALEEVTVLSTTRNNQPIENAPVKAEVLGPEEMEEESSIKPAGIGSILGDVSGVQIQQSSAVNGNANVRIQGLDGRYTQLLRDGLPLYDGFSGGFGILSIPPLDLKQIELIKGSASTLYGGGAIGGLVNMISRKPGIKPEAVLVLNGTTLRELNHNFFFSQRKKYFGYTNYIGFTKQNAGDVNKDGFSDLPELRSFVVHPRYFLYPGKHTTITTGYTFTYEERNGGDMNVLGGKPDAVHQYFEKNRTERNSFELGLQHFMSRQKRLDVKGSLSLFRRHLTSNTIDFTGRQLNYYTEASLFIPYKKGNTVTGINFTGDRFYKVTPTIPLNDFTNTTFGTFIQHTQPVGKSTTIEAGLRDDYHFTYGNFLLPRLALFHRFDEHWATRGGVGLGYKTPNALAPQNTDFALEDIQPLADNLRAETSVGYNAELSYKKTYENGNSFFINQAFFLTRLHHPLIATVQSGGAVVFSNQSKPVLTRGTDTYISATVSDWEIYAGYTFTMAERKYLSQNQFIPLTPKHRMAFTLVKEFEAPGIRIGIEGSYTGRQFRDDGSKTPGYLFIAAMLEKKFIYDRLSVVLNGENLLDYRQSKTEALFTGPLSQPVFKSLWAPIDGRVINLSLKFRFAK